MYATCFLIGGPAGCASAYLYPPRLPPAAAAYLELGGSRPAPAGMQDFFAGRKSIPTYGCFNTVISLSTLAPQACTHDC